MKQSNGKRNFCKIPEPQSRANVMVNFPYRKTGLVKYDNPTHRVDDFGNGWITCICNKQITYATLDDFIIHLQNPYANKESKLKTEIEIEIESGKRNHLSALLGTITTKKRYGKINGAKIG